MELAKIYVKRIIAEVKNTCVKCSVVETPLKHRCVLIELSCQEIGDLGAILNLQFLLPPTLMARLHWRRLQHCHRKKQRQQFPEMYLPWLLG